MISAGGGGERKGKERKEEDIETKMGATTLDSTPDAVDLERERERAYRWCILPHLVCALHSGLDSNVEAWAGGGA